MCMKLHSNLCWALLNWQRHQQIAAVIQIKFRFRILSKRKKQKKIAAVIQVKFRFRFLSKRKKQEKIAALEEEMKEIHALSIKKAQTPQQWKPSQDSASKDDEIEWLHLLKDINCPQRLQRKSLGQSEDFNSEAGDSQLSIEEDSSFQHYYLRQSRHSVTDGETLASSTDAEYDDETEGSIYVASAAEGRKPFKTSDKTKPVTPRSGTTTSEITSSCW